MDYDAADALLDMAQGLPDFGEVSLRVRQLEERVQQQQTQLDQQARWIQATALAKPVILQPDPFHNRPDEDWLSWRQGFHHLVALNGWTDQPAILILKALMKKDAALCTIDLSVQDFPSVETALLEYELRFLPESTCAVGMTEFERAQQAAKETELDWHSRLRRLWIKAYPRDGIESQLTHGFIL